MIYMTSSWYSVRVARRIPNVLLVFGDNLERVGHGGQAQIRDEPNAIGIATKRSCGQFFNGSLHDVQAMVADMLRIEGILMTQQSVLFPINEDGSTSLGCGLSELPQRCPAMYGLLDDWFQRLPNKQRVRFTE